MSPSTAARVRRAFRDVDRESLVVVAVPGDVGFEEDFVAGQFEAEAGRLARWRDDVVDGDLVSGSAAAATDRAARR